MCVAFHEVCHVVELNEEMESRKAGFTKSHKARFTGF